MYDGNQTNVYLQSQMQGLDYTINQHYRPTEGSYHSIFHYEEKKVEGSCDWFSMIHY